MRDRMFDAPGEWALRECSECGLVSLDPRPAPEQLPSFYESYYTHATAPTVTRAKRLLKRVQSLTRFGRETLRAQSMFLDDVATGSVLDVGCGDGSALAFMQQRGWEVAGVEPDATAAAIASKRLNTHIHVGSIRDARFEAASFSAIHLGHVIEHLLDPADTLAECRRVMRSNGRLVILTPNAESLGRKHFGSAWLHWDPPRHIHIFNAKVLTALVEAAGFQVLHAATLTRAAHWAFQASRSIERFGRVWPEGKRAGLTQQLRARLFQLREGFTDAGEELLIVATPVSI